MNKFQFIKQVMETQKFNASQKERFLKLVTKELETASDKELRLFNDVELIKDRLGMIDATDKKLRVLSNYKSAGLSNFTVNLDERDVISTNQEDYGKTIYNADDDSVISYENNETKAEDEAYVKSFVDRLKLEYISKNNKIKDPRSTSLDEKLEKLSNIVNHDFTDNGTLSILEMIKKLHNGNLSKENEVINRFYFLFSQKEVNIGNYESIGISPKTFIVPKDIVNKIISLRNDVRSQGHSKLSQKIKTSSDNKKPTSVKGINYAIHKNLPTFLRSLNANDYTKFLTHSIDSADITNLKLLLNSESYDFDMHLKKIKEVFEVLTEKDSVFKETHSGLNSYFLPRGIYTKIKQYIYGNTWSLEKNIKMYWSHPSIKAWAVENDGKAPSVNEESLNYEGFYFHSSAFNRHMSFSDLILFFKNEIHIRSTNSLYNIISNIYNNPNNSFRETINIQMNISDNLDLYTDVEKLKAAIKLILELIVENHASESKPRVIFNLYIEDEITLTILHENNIFKQDIDTLRYGKSFCNLIKLLNGVCGLDVLAKFDDSKSYHLKLWEYGDTLIESTIYKNNKPLNLKEKLKPIDQDINGVQYNLTFNKGL